MATISFVDGEFQTLYPNRRIHLGRLTLEIGPEDVVEYDGSVLRFRGQTTQYPEFRSIVNTGWLDLIPPSDNPKPPTKASTEVTKMALSREENMVSKVSDPKKDTISPKSFTPSVIKMDEGDHVTVKEFTKRASGKDVGGAEEGEVVATFPSSKQTFVLGEDGKVARKEASSLTPEMESDDSRTVGKVNAPLPSRTTVTDTSRVEQEIRRLETPKKQTRVAMVSTPDGEIHAAEGDTLESILPALDPESRAAMLAKQRKEAIARSEAKLAAEENKAVEEETPLPVVSPRVPTSVEEVIISGDDVEIAPGVVWNKKLHWRTRAKVAVEKYADDPSTLALIRSYEEPSVAKLISDTLAKKNDQ